MIRSAGAAARSRKDVPRQRHLRLSIALPMLPIGRQAGLLRRRRGAARIRTKGVLRTGLGRHRANDRRRRKPFQKIRATCEICRRRRLRFMGLRLAS
jgi:hypothetical protein